MTTPYDQGIEDMLALYQKQRAESADTRRRINEVTGTGSAPRQAVKVTVTAHGELTAVEFPTGAYHRMAPKELADALMAAFAEARADALTKVAELTDLRLPPGVRVADLMEGKVDPGALLPESPGMPDSVSDYLANGRPAGGFRG
ncbi:YbaB/EbfC family nucleoid-associated protein [Streptacidiphilus jiangxiensis]|uniref:Conserved DNA-binding protein YbaB n=1 Tax=Streptacidiphilus jiangxiensis TaxID=235985 RepID=A0A1H7P6R7_STRJI|nr:YbaB/EbfC family nucleoid-associated protein [Streptacidiphilus jiangxiensis]SEL30945.1 Conserved DNA-binding protein YbaB [Streptacidiphilus jiangxiensis]